MTTIQKITLCTLIAPFLMATSTTYCMKRSFTPVENDKLVLSQPEQKKAKTDNAIGLTKSIYPQLQIKESPRPLEAILTFNEDDYAMHHSTRVHKKMTSSLIINGEQPTVCNLMTYVDIHIQPNSLLSLLQEEVALCYANNAAYGIKGITSYQHDALFKKIEHIKPPRIFPLEKLYGLNDGSQFNCTIHGKKTIVTCQARTLENGDFKQQCELRMRLSKEQPQPMHPTEEKEFTEAGLFAMVTINENNGSTFYGREIQTITTYQNRGPNNPHTPDKHGNTGFEKLALAPTLKKHKSLYSFVTQREIGNKPKIFTLK